MDLLLKSQLSKILSDIDRNFVFLAHCSEMAELSSDYIFMCLLSL